MSVRSGARASMPGMMDTVLNLGLNDQTVVGLAKRADERFAFDSYRRFIQMYGDVVLGVPHHRFESIASRRPRRAGSRARHRSRGDGSASLVPSTWRSSRSTRGAPFPQDPQEQLWGAIGAVFGSWDEQPPAIAIAV